MSFFPSKTKSIIPHFSRKQWYAKCTPEFPGLLLDSRYAKRHPWKLIGEGPCDLHTSASLFYLFVYKVEKKTLTSSQTHLLKLWISDCVVLFFSPRFVFYWYSLQ